MIDPIELHALADGELTADQETVLRIDLELSRSAQVELQTIFIVKRMLQQNATVPDSAEVWKKCVHRLDDIDRVKRVERVVSNRFALGLCSVFFVAILVAGVMRRGTPASNVNTTDLAWMVGSFRPAQNANPPSQTTQLIDQLMKLAPNSIDPRRMDIRGVGYGELDGQPATRFTLRDSSGDLALMVVPTILHMEGMGELKRDHSFRLGHVGTMNCVSWTDGSSTLVLVADRPYEDLATVASKFEIK